MKRNVFAKRKVMKGIDVNRSPEIRYWGKLYSMYYPNDRMPLAFIYDVAWNDIANKRLLEEKKII